VSDFSQLGVLKTVYEADPSIRELIAKDYPDATIVGDIVPVLEYIDIQGVVIAAPAVQHFKLAQTSLSVSWFSVNRTFDPFVINHHKRREVHEKETPQLHSPGEGSHPQASLD
jgi:hypothetical protein